VQPPIKLLEYYYRQIRTDARTESTPGTAALVRHGNYRIPLQVQVITQFNQAGRTSNGAETAPFATNFINLNSGHVY
jgi:hypothetical protein